MVATFRLALVLFVMQIQLRGQVINFVKDKVMDHYMASGEANHLFVPEGEVNKERERVGFWKDYSVFEEIAYCFIDSNQIKQVEGRFLLYGEGNYVNGKREGVWKFCAIEDITFKKIFHSEKTYVDGNWNGLVKFYYTNGNIAQSGNYANGKPVGEVTCYFPYGEVHSALLYNKDGDQEGEQKYYYRSGHINVIQHYENGMLNGPYRSYYENDTLKESFTYLNGKTDGMYRYYYNNGQLCVEREVHNGLEWNVTGNYKRTGEARDKGTLKDGDGTLKYYDEDGKVYLIRTFEEGKKVKEEKR